MSIFWNSWQKTLKSLAPPLLVCLAVSVLIAALTPRSGAVSSGSWLHLPALLLAAASLAAALDAWPLFSRGRPGRDWLERIENQPTHGCVAAALGSAAALGVSLAAVGVLFSCSLEFTEAAPRPLSLRVHYAAQTPRGLLSPAQPVLRFQTHQGSAITRLVVRPTPIYLPGQPLNVSLTIHGDGQVLHDGPLSNVGDRIDLAIDPPRSLKVIELRTQDGQGGALRVTPADIEGLAPSSIPTWVNGLLAGLSYLLPAALGLAVMVLGHYRLAFPVNLITGLGFLLVATLADLTPNSLAISAFARGRWLGAEQLGVHTLLSLAGVGGVLALAWLAGKMGRYRQP